MHELHQPDDVVRRLIQWAEDQPAVRAMLLTSTRANPDAPVDALSDYDVVLVVTDIRPFHADRGWLADFGEVLVGYWDPIQPAPGYGLQVFGNVIQYADGLHIDFTLWPVDLLRRIVADDVLIADLDDGYRVLLDKDGLTEGLRTPTYTVFIPEPPHEAAFLTVVENFYSTAPYVAKNLWRDDLMPAKWGLQCDMKHNFLRPMLDWRVEIDHDWAVKTGVNGRGLKGRLPHEIWDRLERTYAGAGLEENWNALLAALDLFRDVATEVAVGLGYEFPEAMHRGVRAYVEQVRRLDPDVT